MKESDKGNIDMEMNFKIQNSLKSIDDIEMKLDKDIKEL